MSSQPLIVHAAALLPIESLTGVENVFTTGVGEIIIRRLEPNARSVGMRHAMESYIQKN